MVRKPLRHDRDRRRLDPSNVPQPTPIVATVTSTGTTNVSIEFDQPCIIKGTFPILVDGDPCTGQVVVDNRHITLVASGNVAGKVWTIPANSAGVRNPLLRSR